MIKPKNKYTKQHFNFVAKLVKKGVSVTESTRQMAKEFGMEYSETMGRKFREKMQKAGITENVNTLEDTPEFKKARKRKLDKTKQRFIFTWAQNDTDIHIPFLENIEAYAEFLDASVHIIAGRYKNPNSIKASKQLKNTEVWHPKVQPYLDANRHNVHKYLTVLSDIKTQPTASTPLTGFNGIAGSNSTILGHPRIHLKTLPVLEGYPHKMLMTTGAVSVPNYTDSKAGGKGAFHHSYGFVIVELDGDIYHIRQVTADRSGTFYDLFYKVENSEIMEVISCPAMVFGDLHLNVTNEEALDVSFSLARKIKPEKIVLHDLFDGASISHHESKNPFILLQREKDGTLSLKKEIKRMKQWLKKHNDFNYILTRANHDDFFDRWLINNDWRKNPNKELYLKYASILAKGKAPKGIVPYIIDKEFSDFVTTLDLDESYRIMDWEISVHGHIGASGSRGSATQFKNLSTKLITAHSHSASREDSHICVGTLTDLRIGYNRGMSGWNHSNAIIHPNGKAQQVHIIRGKYTTLLH